MLLPVFPVFEEELELDEGFEDELLGFEELDEGFDELDELLGFEELELLEDGFEDELELDTFEELEDDVVELKEELDSLDDELSNSLEVVFCVLSLLFELRETLNEGIVTLQLDNTNKLNKTANFFFIITSQIQMSTLTLKQITQSTLMLRCL